MLAGESCSPPQRVSSTPRMIAEDAGLGGGAGGVAPLPRGGGRERLPLAEARRDPDEHGAAGSSRARALLGAGVRARGSPGGVIVGTRVQERAQGSSSAVCGRSGASAVYLESSGRAG